MDKETIERLRMLNARFYSGEHSSFSQTRRSPWPGWRRCLARAIGAEDVEGCSYDDAAEHVSEATILDLACGNLRFERFLGEELPNAHIDVYAVDSCDELVGNSSNLKGFARRDPSAPADWLGDGTSRFNVKYQSLDIIGAIGSGSGCALAGAESSGVPKALQAEQATQEPHTPLDPQAPQSPQTPQALTFDIPDNRPGEALSSALEASGCNLSVCFGFMHHVPTFGYRKAVLEALADCTCKGGTVAVSFWEFMENPKMAQAALETSSLAAGQLGLGGKLDDGDYLLGWRGKSGVYRYCHSFTHEEVEELAKSVAGKAVVADSFCSDGRDGKMNEYLVLRVI